MTPRISVIMPAFNVGAYIKEAVESILQQTYTDFELLIINDGSTDSTEEVVLSLQDERIVYIKNEQNIGLANTINKGMLLARGEFIARMDSDDLLKNERLQVQIDYLDSHSDVDLCSVGLEMFGATNGIILGETNFEQVKIALLFSSAIGHASSMFRRKSFVDNQLFFDQNFFPAEDYELWTRAVMKLKLVNIPEVLYLYRMHESQVTKVDLRAVEKSKELQYNYIKQIFPEMVDEKINFFIQSFIHSTEFKDRTDIEVSFEIIRQLEEYNHSTKFFDSELFHKTLKSAFRFRVQNYLRSFPLALRLMKFSLLRFLSIKQILSII